MYKLMLLALLALAPTGASIASSNDAFAPEKGLDLSRSFEAQREAILKALGDGETYSEIAAEDLQIVKESLDRISSLLDGAQSVGQLPEGTKVRVFNEQERINTLLGRAHADSRVVCKREKPTGSNRPANTCMTVAERRRAREGATDFMRYQPKAQARPDSR
ncbi:hypothetical protein [Pseudoxanthomonas putridarboris]|uniref:Secreted protein n=1 Tax=Pseudoxanthomonas putridarboris TaxID=752605 RepID=A0ABU9J4F2_9GAMM